MKIAIRCALAAQLCSLLLLILGCGGRSPIYSAPAISKIAFDHAAGIVISDPNLPPGCVGIPVSTDGFGGCPFKPAYKPQPGKVWKLCDGFSPQHCLFIRQEIWPGFDGVTGIVWHYVKTDLRTSPPARVAGDDGMGYWCAGHPEAELFFGLTHKTADPSKHIVDGWYSTHQLINCGTAFGAADIDGPGYLIIGDYPGDTGPTFYASCGRTGVFINDPTAWTVHCVPAGQTGWDTLMTRDANKHPITIQSEGPKALPGGCGTITDCRFYSQEGWSIDCDPSIDTDCPIDGSVDMLAIHAMDDGVHGANTDPRLSMKLIEVFWKPQ